VGKIILGHPAIATSRRLRCSRLRARIAAMFDPADAPDADLVYEHYLKTCAMVRRR